MVFGEHRFDNRPCSFDRILTGEERAIPGHRIAK
jgi:hypothetical protein